MTYIDHKEWGLREGCEQSTAEVSHSWQHFTQRRLLWLYGPERAQSIEAGNDTRTQVDLASWRSLGRRSAA